MFRRHSRAAPRGGRVLRLIRPFAIALLCVLPADPGALGAQETSERGEVTGRVINAVTRAPLGSAQVVIAGTGIGTLSRADGTFTLSAVPAGERSLEVHLVGYASAAQPITVTGESAIVVDVELRESAISLNEIVVTGVGAAARRREVGNSIAQIDVGQSATKPVSNVENLLRGAAPGVQGLSVSGQVGGGGVVQLRGVNSVSQGNEPLIYVDGVRLATSRIPPAALEDGRGPRISGMSLNELNLGDIERIEIIKGAAATTIYGTEAASGVIQIFTKRGAPGAPQWSFSTTQGANFWPQMSDVIRSHETSLGLDNVMRTGHLQRYDASVRGGDETWSYFFSGSYFDENGIVDTQWSDGGSFTGNITVRLLDNLNLHWNATYSTRNTRYVGDSNNRHAYILNVMRLDQGYRPGSLDATWVLEQELLGRTDNFITGINLEHVLPFGVRNQLRVGLHHLESASSGLLPYGYYLYPAGSIGAQRWRDRTVTTEYTGTWEAAVGDAVRSTFVWGGQVFSEERLGVEAGGLDFPGPGEFTVSSAARTFSSESRIKEVNAGFFFEEKVGIHDRLFLIGGLRFDGTSTFGEDYGLQAYPKLSASYVVSDLPIWPQDWWNSMRLRAAIGEAGKAPGAFDAVRTWNPIAGLEGQAGVTPSNLGNADLGPERTREIELGFDAAVLDSRLALELTYYNARTNQALFPVLPIPSQGFTNDQVRNVGELRSNGLELSIDVAALRDENLSWSLGANVTTTNSKVEDMGGAAPISFGYQQWAREGYAPPSFFGRRVTNPDALEDPVFEDDAFLGRTFPDLTVGFSSELTFGSLTLSALGELSTGGHILNSTGYLNSIRGIWPACTPIQAQAETPEGYAQLTALERARCLSPFNGEDQWVESGDFFRVRDVSASFRLPASLLPGPVRSATLTVSGTNLFRFTDFTGMDPEVIESGASGTQNFRRVDYYNFPPRRTIATKLSVTF